jgi:DNA polymerase-1
MAETLKYSKYEKARMIGSRALQLSMGAPFLVKLSEEELQKLSNLHPIIADILAFRELQKLLSTYIEKMPALLDKEGRLHAEFIQAGTTTGRMSSQDPNLQNIPIKTEYGKRIRQAFAAKKGFVLVALDYSQIGLRIAAGLSGDKKLVEAFQSGADVHTAVAAEVFGVAPERVDYEMRRRAKVINFGILYGMGVHALAGNLGVSYADAKRFRDEYFKTFHILKQYLDTVVKDAKQNGYTETLFGRRREFEKPGFESPGSLALNFERMAMNAPLQGTAADIIKLAMIAADQVVSRLPADEAGECAMLLTVHDELLYEIPASRVDECVPLVRTAMERIMKSKTDIPFPVHVSVGERWGEMKEIQNEK